jgi:uncharacterized protein YhaN
MQQVKQELDQKTKDNKDMCDKVLKSEKLSALRQEVLDKLRDKMSLRNTYMNGMRQENEALKLQIELQEKLNAAASIKADDTHQLLEKKMDSIASTEAEVDDKLVKLNCKLDKTDLLVDTLKGVLEQLIKTTNEKFKQV